VVVVVVISIAIVIVGIIILTTTTTTIQKVIACVLCAEGRSLVRTPTPNPTFI
jgi:hypothetical protein